MTRYSGPGRPRLKDTSHQIIELQFRLKFERQPDAIAQAEQLPALPIFLANEDRIIGLMFLLTIALRCFTLIEFQVRRSLQTLQTHLAGLYAGNPKRKTERPSAEQLLKAFVGMTLYHHRDGTAEITPLNNLQRRILALMKLPESIYELPLKT